MRSLPLFLGTLSFSVLVAMTFLLEVEKQLLANKA
jgi:hypothetical protein